MTQVEAWGEYEQERAISELSAKYGRGALYLQGFLYDDPETGSARVGKAVLKAFQQLKKGRVSWDNSAFAWIVEYYKTGLPEDPRQRRDVLKHDEARLSAEIAALESPEMWMLQRHGHPSLKSAEETVQKLARLRLRLFQCRRELGQSHEVHRLNTKPARPDNESPGLFGKLLSRLAKPQNQSAE
jgi:hypothetical protein